MKKLPLVACFLFYQMLFSVCLAQTDTIGVKARSKYQLGRRESTRRLLIGYHLQQAYRDDGKEYSRKYVELGLHKTTIVWGYHGLATFTHGPSIELAPEVSPTWGLKYGAWASTMFFGLGLNVIYYTDFNYGNLKIRPEILLGMGYIKVSGGYNIPTIWNKDFKRLRRSGGHVSISLLPFKFKTISRIEPTKQPPL